MNYRPHPQLTEQTTDLTQREQVPGLALAISRAGSLEYFQGFGWRDAANKLPVTLDTVFGVASVTKSVTCLAVMQLVDAGQLKVTDPVANWLPEFRVPNPEWNRKITVHHLMTHSSGLPGLPCLFGARVESILKDPNRKRLGYTDASFDVPRIKTYEDLLRVIGDTDFELLGPPGHQFNYSNEGFALLQGVIERASGRDFISYAQERILDPIGMSRSTFLAGDLDRFPEVQELYAVELKDGRKEVFYAPVWWDVAGIYTNGSLKSTARDLLRYLEVYRTGGLVDGERIVSSEGVRQMLTPHIQTPLGSFYGYGLMVDPNRHGFTVVHHGGSIKGVASHVAVVPEHDLTVVTLANLSGFNSQKVGFMAVESAVGLPAGAVSKEFPPYSIDQDALADYAGEYRSGEGDAASVSLEADSTLLIKIYGERFDVRPYGPDAFVSETGERPFVFLRDAQGQIRSLFVGMRVLPRVRGSSL